MSSKSKQKKSKTAPAVVHPPKSVQVPFCARTVVKTIQSKLARLDALKQKYFMSSGVDAKTIDSKMGGSTDKLLSALEAELKTDVLVARQTFASALGGKALKIVLPYSISLSNTAGGICDVVTAIDVSNLSEWPSLQALFDEYRLMHLKACFQTVNPSAAANSSALPVWGWDPVDGTVLTSTRNGCELEHHRLFAAPNVSGAGGSVIVQSAPPTFAVRIKPDEALTTGNTGLVASTPGVWKALPTLGSNVAYDGYMKVYHANTGANGALHFLAIWFFTVELRSRT